jgi:hypothetical protein
MPKSVGDVVPAGVKTPKENPTKYETPKVRKRIHDFQKINFQKIKFQKIRLKK